MNKLLKHIKNSNKGVTLTALAATVVVLLILAGITINMAFGDNGVINKANYASNKTQQDQQEDTQVLKGLKDELDYMLNSAIIGITLSQTEAEITIGATINLNVTVTPDDLENKNVNWASSDESIVTVENGTVKAVGIGEATITVTTAAPSDRKAECKVSVKSTLARIIGKPAASVNQTAKDEYGNKIVIPAGFIVKPHTGTSLSDVTYGYSGNTSSPTVQDGIVIENEEDGNQFVWVPIGEIKNKDNTTTEITLGRYDDFTIAANGTLPIPVQVASKTNYDEPIPIGDYVHIEISNNFIGGTFNEIEYKSASEYIDSNGNTNTKAYDLQEWISTTIDNRGYYIARYEASKNGEKAASKISTGTLAINGFTTISDGMLWNNITQPDAAIASKKMYQYSSQASYYSDLANSYSRDTVIIFIQLYSEDNDYANRDGNLINSNLTNTGVNDDKVCNIHDIAGNIYEWTTETREPSSICTFRGGNFYSKSTPKGRGGMQASFKNNNFGFRVILCVK